MKRLNSEGLLIADMAVSILAGFMISKQPEGQTADMLIAVSVVTAVSMVDYIKGYDHLTYEPTNKATGEPT